LAYSYYACVESEVGTKQDFAETQVENLIDAFTMYGSGDHTASCNTGSINIFCSPVQGYLDKLVDNKEIANKIEVKPFDYKIYINNLWYYATQNIDEDIKDKIRHNKQLDAFEKQKIVKTSFKILLSQNAEKYKNIIFKKDNDNIEAWNRIDFAQEEQESNNFYNSIKENPQLLYNIHYGDVKEYGNLPFFAEQKGLLGQLDFDCWGD
jgi:hypothetical protein